MVDFKLVAWQALALECHVIFNFQIKILDSEKKFGLKYLLIPRKLLVFFLTANTPDMTGPNDTLLNYFIIKMAS